MTRNDDFSLDTSMERRHLPAHDHDNLVRHIGEGHGMPACQPETEMASLIHGGCDEKERVIVELLSCDLGLRPLLAANITFDVGNGWEFTGTDARTAVRARAWSSRLMAAHLYAMLHRRGSSCKRCTFGRSYRMVHGPDCCENGREMSASWHLAA